MIDGFKPRKRPHLHPRDQHLTSQMIIGGRLVTKPDQPKDHPKPEFKTPVEVEKAEEQNSATSTTSVLYKKQAEQKRSFFSRIMPHGKKQWIIYSSALVILLAGAGVSAYLMLNKPAAPAKKQAVVKKEAPAPPKITTVASNLTGLQVQPNINDRPVTGVMIENSLDARPQSSLDQAGVVFEAIAEGGITRFLALYQDNEPTYIGPVRSVRPYYIQWAMGFDAPLAHVGGSPEALASMKQWGAKDLDQFAGGAYFWRISSRFAPHNVYTDTGKLREYQSKKGYGKSNYTGFARKVDTPAVTPNVNSIDFTISSSIFNPHYDYDKTTNSYKRSEGGAAHMSVDQAGVQTQLNPKVVLALVLPQSANGKYTVYQTIGSGTAYVFQDGVVNQVTWKKDSNGGPLMLTDAAGASVKLNAGQTWISVVGDSSRVTYR